MRSKPIPYSNSYISGRNIGSLSAVYRRYNGDPEIEILDAWHKYVPGIFVSASQKH